MNPDQEPGEGPPFSEAEYAELARRYRESGGHLPDADERAADQAALRDSVPPRRPIQLPE